MRRATHLAVMAILALAATSVMADTIELRNGQIMNGKYVGGTATTVSFEASDGTKVVATTDIVALTFASGGSAAAPTTAPSGAAAAVPAEATAAPAAAPTPVTVPAGTVLTVKMDNAVSSKDPEGKKFT